tara:strand:- start:67 stop:1005 length:939 start_codon:yes stop_codon:yes gene_type:complete
MSANDSEIEDAIDHLGDMETDEDVSTDTGESDATEDTIDSSTSTSSGLEIVRSYANNSSNTEREMGGKCMVCYVELDLFNIVNMPCSHKMCNKCFPKWMSTNASCPSCRYKMATRVHLTDEELEREIGQLHSYYLHTADKFFKSHKEYVNLKRTTDALMCRQISLTKQIEETEGALVGAAMAIEEVDMELSQEEKVLCKPKLAHARTMKNTPWLRGYNIGYHRGVELVHKQQDRVYDVLEETRGPNLFDYGFTKERCKKKPIEEECGEKKYHGKGKPKKKVRIRKRTREPNTSSDEDEVQQDNLEAVAEEVV